MAVFSHLQRSSQFVLQTGLLLALLATPTRATLDRDNDGISDLWAALYPTAGSAAQDPDGDGANNLAEAIAGTDPTAPSSRFGAAPQRDADGNLRLRWYGVPGKQYQLRSSPDLTTWTTLPEVYSGTGAELAPIIARADETSAPRLFFQVVVSDADTDADTLNDWEEAQLGTSPTAADTDGDELRDDWEVAHGTDPRIATPPVVTTPPAPASIAEGQTATFTVAAVGDGPFSYQWLRDGTPIPDAQFLRHTTAPATLGDSGATFSVRITDAAGRSTISLPATLSVVAATRRTQHYVDPVNGADDGDGSAAHPWRSLQTVVENHVETRNWNALPYAEGRTLVPVHPGAAIRAGDTIWLRSGYHGALDLRSAYNTAPITVAAAPSHTPRFSRILVQSAQNWILRGLQVSPSFAGSVAGNVVIVEDHNWRGPASDIEIDGLEVFTVPDEGVWTTAADWDTQASTGINTTGARVWVHRCRLRNVNFGISMTGRAVRVDHNTIDGFCGDGLRGLGDDSIFEDNLVKNRRAVNDNHPDGFQSWSLGDGGGVGSGVVRNIILRGNVFIAFESPAIPFAGVIQGIGCYDGFYDGWIVENNLVVTNHWHGITFQGARHCRIVNNTVVDLVPGDDATPWILVDSHKNGTPATDSVVRNNLTTALRVGPDAAHNIVVDHNLVLPTDLSGYFIAPSLFDYRLAPNSPAIDQGSLDLAPTSDASGTPRPQGAAIDIGAYEHASP